MHKIWKKRKSEKEEGLRGLALVDPERRKEIASMGGKAGGGRFTSETASLAGKKSKRPKKTQKVVDQQVGESTEREINEEI
jgi:general stress protein YciG